MVINMMVNEEDKGKNTKECPDKMGHIIYCFFKSSVSRN